MAVDYKDIRETEKSVRVLGEALDETIQEIFSEKLGFALLLFDFKNPGLANFMSNAERFDMIKALRETADRLESRDYKPIGEKEKV